MKGTTKASSKASAKLSGTAPGKAGDSSSVPAAAALGEFNRYLRSQHSNSIHTCSAYLSDVQFLWQWAGTVGIDSPEGFTTEKLMLWQHQTLARTAPASQRRRIAAIKCYFGWAVTEQLCSSDPATQLQPPRNNSVLPDFLTERELFEVLDRYPGAGAVRERDRALFLILYATGIRRAEVVSLCQSMIDRKRRLIRVRGKGNKERVVPVAAAAINQLQHYEECWRREELPVSDSEAVFLNQRGGRLSARSVGSIINGFRTVNGVASTLHPHMLRHTFATHMLGRGADLRMLQESLGHASLSTTQRYTHLQIEQLRAIHDQTHPRSRLPATADHSAGSDTEKR